MFQQRVSVHSSASARFLEEKKEKRGDLILIIGHQSLYGPNVLVFTAQWTD